jgi:RimJ/RimL family protein N-acetyltransferase
VTFLIVDPTLPPTPLPSTSSLGCLCGDVNLFLHSYLHPLGELEVMIAEPLSRRKGIAVEALTLIMAYAREVYGVHGFVVKVGGANEASLKMFRDKLGFEEAEYVDVFDEFELRSPPCRCTQCSAVR